MVSDVPPLHVVLRFGPFTVNVLRRELWRSGAPVEIGARALDLLVHFLRHPSLVIPGAELVRAVWQGRAVEANNLTVQLSHLRRILGEGVAEPTIRTIPNLGYMFMPTVEAGPDDPAPAATAGPSAGATAGDERLGPPAGVTDWLGMREPAGPFIGRLGELADLSERLARHRLVTVIGMGGVGKTRLALRAAALLGQTMSVVAVDLVSLPEGADADRVREAVAMVLGGGGDAVSPRSVVPILRSRRSLLVLDNAEHLVEGVRDFLQGVLGEMAAISVLVTSRCTVGLPGEAVLRLMPLGTPAEGDALSAAAAMRFESVQIFVALATLLIPDFRFDDCVAPHVVAICRRLDGIALAIGMAVPRLQVLSPRQLSERLQQHFGVLAATATVHPRQRTLQTMFDWSWALLPPLERCVLQQLAVFSGGAPLGLLVGIAAQDGHSEWDTLAALVRLVESSLVIPDLVGQEPRYGLLESTRVFALAQAADRLPALRRAHADQVAGLMQRAEAEWPTLHGDRWLERYGGEASNLRAAVTWALGEDGEPALALRLVAYACPLLWERPGALMQDGRAWTERAMALLTPGTPPALAARLWFGYSWRDARMSDIWNLDKAMTAVDLFRALDDRMGQGAALWRAGCAAMTPETMDLSERLFTEAEALLRTLPPSKWLALCLGKRGDILARRGDPGPALALCEEALAIIRDTGHEFGLMTVGSNMADMMLALGQPERALAHVGHVVSLLRPTVAAPAATTQAAHQLLAGQVDAALHTAMGAARQSAILGLTATLAWAAEVVALIEAGRAAPERAARLAGYALRVHPATPFRYGARREVFRRLSQALDLVLPPDRLRALHGEGAAWTDEEAGEMIAATPKS